MLHPIETSAVRHLFAYDFVVRVPLPLDRATARMEAFLKGRKSLFSHVHSRMDGRTFEIWYERMPMFFDIEGEIVPNDLGTTDINVHVPHWEIALLLTGPVFFAIAVSAGALEFEWIGALLMLLGFVGFLLMTMARGPNLQHDIVRAFMTP